MTNKYCTFPHCECSMGAAERCKHPKAPAATDTGLVTVGNGVFANGEMVGFVGLGFEFKDPDDNRKREPICRRSQAEELLEAKEAERAEQWRLRREMEADRDTQKAIATSLEAELAAEREKVLFLKTAMEIAQTHCGLKDKTIDSLEADNAAQAARIKELEKLCNDTEAEALGYASDKAELEAKLATAEVDAQGYKSTIEHLRHRAETAEASIDRLIGHLTDVSGKIGAFHDADDEDAEMHILDDIQTIILAATEEKHRG